MEGGVPKQVVVAGVQSWVWEEGCSTSFVYLFLAALGLHRCAGFLYLLLSSCGAQASHCGGFSCCGAQGLGWVGFCCLGAQ